MSGTPSTPAVRVAGLGKCFNWYARPSHIFWEAVTRLPRHDAYWALRDINFEVAKGEVLGIVGRNGSGKSTLLRLIAGVLDCSEGTVETDGKVSAILELGTGFHGEYSGRENVIRGGLVQGMSRAEIEAKLDSIIEFSGLREFIDQPFKTYSSGMQARLTFATATAIDPDILIVDEALATGDAYFVQKSLSRIREICQSGATVMLVSHSTGILGAICDRVMWLDDGRLRDIGKSLDVIREYDLSVQVDLSAGEGRVEPSSTPTVNAVANGNESGASAEDLFSSATVESTASRKQTSVFRRGPIRVEQVEFLNKDDQPSRSFAVGDPMTIRVRYACEGPLPHESLGLALAVNRKSDLMPIFTTSTHAFTSSEDMRHYEQAPFRRRPSHAGVIEACINPMQCQPGSYLLSLGLLPNIPAMWVFYEYHHLAYELNIAANAGDVGGLFHPQVAWSHRPAGPFHRKETVDSHLELQPS